MEDEFYDLCYEAWRVGRNVDSVSYDDYEYMRSMGFYPDEITLNDVFPDQEHEPEENS